LGLSSPEDAALAPAILVRLEEFAGMEGYCTVEDASAISRREFEGRRKMRYRSE